MPHKITPIDPRTAAGPPAETSPPNEVVEHADQLWDEKQTARYLGVAPKTLRSWRTMRSSLPFAKLSGRLIRYRRSDVELFVARSMRTSTSDT